MAKKIGISVDAWDGKHYKRVDRYARQIDDIYSALSQEAGIIGASVTNFNQNKPFTFADYPSTKQRIDRLLKNLQNNVSFVVNNGTREEWLLACQKNDAIVKNLFNNQKLDKVRLDHYYSRNLDALDAFQKRKVNGMNLSERVWNLTDQTKQELEMSIDLGLIDGKSASQMGREIKKHLNDPNKLFRRVKDERGAMQLSKNAKAYHPGQGVYRSSKGNAMRLTRTETNMAYRASDNERWNQLEFILGYEIKRSNNPYPCPVCEALKGKYPKTFKFVGWHPNCRCFQVPILADLNDFLDYETKILDGEDVSGYDFKNEITELPDNFTQWISQNGETLASRKSVPYFIRDNFKAEDIKNGLKPVPVKAPIKKLRTKEEKDAIQQKWENRSVERFNQKRIEQKLNIEKGAAMDFETANEMRGNINYGSGEEYRVNCQSCVVANELRRRGFDVSALPNLRKKGNIPYELSFQTEKAWIDKNTGKMPKKEKAGGPDGITRTGSIKSKTIRELEKDLNKLTAERGRYHIDFVWKGQNSGHIITVEKLPDGKIRLYDPQNGKLVSWADISKKISLRYGVNVLRVDNLLVNTDIIDKVVFKK